LNRLPALIRRSALAAIPVLGVCLSGTAYAAAAHQAASGDGGKTSGVKVVLFDCPGNPVAEVRPSSYTVFCGDGGDTYIKMHWTTWTLKVARATSVLTVNTCTPDCVAGHYKDYNADVTLSGNTAVKGHPREVAYTHMTVTFPGKRPAGMARTSTSKLYVP
jgi:hypothetical protein